MLIKVCNVLHGIMNEQGNCLDVRDNISEKYYFHMFSYKSLASGALSLVIIVIADNKPMNFTDVISNLFIKYLLMPIMYT